MSFFISDAMAADAAGGGADLMQMVPLVVIFIIFYFLLLRPQIKRAKEHKKMTEALSKNDEVVTTGGIAGKVTKIEDSFVTMQIAEGVEVQVQRSAIGSLLPKGSLKL